MLECVINVSEGRDGAALAALARAAGDDLLDLHSDPDHHRSVLTLVGLDAPRAVATTAVELLDLRTHAGAHPRLGVLDVVPFVPLGHSTMDEAVAARDAFATWLADALAVPSFLYGPERTLPDVRRHAFRDLAPDHGPGRPHPTAGATAVGARPVLVAFNVWMSRADLSLARRVAAAVRGPAIRALGLQVGEATQVSMNLVRPAEAGPAQAYALVEQHLRREGASIERAELVGLIPQDVLAATPREDWARLDLSPERTIEARLDRRGRRD